MLTHQQAVSSTDPGRSPGEAVMQLGHTSWAPPCSFIAKHRGDKADMGPVLEFSIHPRKLKQVQQEARNTW